MRLTVGNLARAFHSLDRVDEAEARRRVRLARAQGCDAPLVAWSSSLFTLAGAIGASTRLDDLGVAETDLVAIIVVAGLLASLVGLIVRDWLLGRALARPERLRRCVCCAHDLTGVPSIDRVGDVRCPECGRVSHLGNLSDA
ncbi:MAG: hypothetical protein AAGK04_13230 [Planctomycetota bacterium]